MLPARRGAPSCLLNCSPTQLASVGSPAAVPTRGGEQASNRIDIEPTCRMHLHKVYFNGFSSCPFIRARHGGLLCSSYGRVQWRLASCGVDGTAKNLQIQHEYIRRRKTWEAIGSGGNGRRATHCAVDVVTVSDCILKRLKDDACDAFTPRKSICGRIERLALAILGKHARLGILNPFVDPGVMA